jgi:cell division transport system permease protein
MSRNNVLKRPSLSGDGRRGRIRYFASRAVSNLRQNLLASILTIGTITLALLIISLFLIIYVNLEDTADQWSRKVEVTVYYEQDLASQEVNAIKNRVLAIPGTWRVSYVNKDEAIKRFRSRLKGQETLLDGVTAEVLPSAFEISLKRDYRTSEAIEAYVAKLSRLQGIGEIQYGEEWVKKFTTFLQFMRFLGLLVGAFLLLAVVFIVSNTIKLTILARKDELEILGLVGATRLFIKAPFLLEGVMQGAIGACLAVMLLSGTYWGILYNAGNFMSFNPVAAGLSFLPWHYLAGILAGGIILGFIGSLTSLKKFVQ